MSAQPSAPAGPGARARRVTAPQITARKGGDPIVCLTAYDAPTARLLDPHVDLILVGDSVGMVVHGLDTTVGVTLDMMIMHGQAVMRGAERAMVVVDLPFGAYEASVQDAFRAAARVMAETGCQAVKIESGPYAADTVDYLVERGIPVMAHVGLRPQSMHVFGGFRARGREAAERRQILEAARAADRAGAFAMVIEGVPPDLADEITAEVSAPTIGIGASSGCDGQILVTPDMLGVFERTPKFVREFGTLREAIDQAVTGYAAAVKDRSFPAPEHTYASKPKS